MRQTIQGEDIPRGSKVASRSHERHYSMAWRKGNGKGHSERGRKAAKGIKTETDIQTDR